MSIKEQIKIARLIASGTPREVAINESNLATREKVKTVTPEIVGGETKKYASIVQKKKEGQTYDTTATKVGGDLAKVKSASLKQKETTKKNGAVVKSVNNNKINRKPRTSPGRDPDMGPLRRTTVTDLGPAPTKTAKPIQSVGSLSSIDKDEGEASATQKLGKNVLKGGTKVLNLGKRLTGRKVEKDGIDYKKLAKELNKEEFIQEVEDKKDSKAKKVIDIMKGKNPIKINPDMKEDTIVVQDASGKDSVEIVDIISPQKVRSDWRKEINVTEASAAWQRKEGKSKSGGLNEKGRKSYERQNPGSDLKAPSKKVGNKRRASFCARMKGMKKKLTSAKTARDPNSRINKSLRAWNC